MSFTRIWTVRFSDTDPFGIAHYPRMIDAVHETSDMCMEAIGWPFWELSQTHEFGLPLVSMDFDFNRQIAAGDDVAIELLPTVGETSVQFEYTATHDGDIVFEGTEHRVCVPIGGDSGIEIPDDLRRSLETVDIQLEGD
ncbi:acyl-CoA thioesterase [Halostagnicola sp. A-GB9-2]|uniref:acyl-CoA thioesterase n=1 Tax=Halostagnicola sp. A-GB9-2 TaxID=3048066 RepID=UPI0024C0650E|nr:acyl-CoA thioesterase [Halostagnicola sp. A-GB9-2]MDJ1433996.1 acyl-CoA thioesterase [Halostagnicola sp. A-GB9-2]